MMAMGAGRIFRDFTGWTSAHGLPHIGNARGIGLRIFWGIVCVCALGMLVFQVVVLVLNYLRYDVTVQTELKFEERDFPAVTICNMNPFRNSQLHLQPKFQWMLSNYSLAMEFKANQTHPMWGFEDLENDTVAIQSVAKNHLVFIGSELKENNATIADELVFQTKELILSCAYNKKPCDMDKDFEQRWDAIYGACYTFNPKMPATYKSSRAGPLYGMRLLVKSNQSEYLASTESVGVRVTVHGQDEEAFPDAMGYNAAAGFTSAFGIKYVRTERMDHPYGNCTHGSEDASNYLYTGAYSTEGCFRSCLQKKVIETCGCADPRMAKPNDSVQCTQKHANCVGRFTTVSSNYDAMDVNCVCRQPCIESTHAVTVSTALWPSDSYSPSECSEESVSWSDEDGCRKWYGQNTLVVEVFYERMNYQLLLESEAYSLVQLVSDIGGQFGLWMGISVITMVEVFSLMLALGLFYGLNMNKPQNEDDSKSNKDPRKSFQSADSLNQLYSGKHDMDSLPPNVH